MPERDGYIPGVPCWIDTNQPDPDAALPFYGGLFGWEFEDVMPEGSPGSYFIGRIRGGDVAAVGSTPEGAPPVAVWNTYIWVDSADEAAAKVGAAGGTVVAEPFDVMDAGRMAVSPTPRGRCSRVWQAEGAQGRQGRQRARRAELQRPGHPRRWRAPRRSTARCSGGRRWRLPAGAMWTLPGYGDHLEEATPGAPRADGPDGRAGRVHRRRRGDQPDRRRRHRPRRRTGASRSASTTSRPPPPRRTSSAARCVGGPFDAPWTRMAIIKDPQGATFIASQFVPENKDLVA